MPLLYVHGVNTRRGDTDDERQVFDNRVKLLKEQFNVAFADRVKAGDGLKVFAPYGVHPLGWTGMRLFNWPSAGRVPLQS